MPCKIASLNYQINFVTFGKKGFFFFGDCLFFDKFLFILSRLTSSQKKKKKKIEMLKGMKNIDIHGHYFCLNYPCCGTGNYNIDSMTEDEFRQNRGLCIGCHINHTRIEKAWDEFKCDNCDRIRRERIVLSCPHRICNRCLTPKTDEYKMGCPFAQSISSSLFIWQTKCPIYQCHSRPRSIHPLRPIKLELSHGMYEQYLHHRHSIKCVPLAMKKRTLEGIDTLAISLFAPLTVIVSDDALTLEFQFTLIKILKKMIRMIDKENALE